MISNTIDHVLDKSKVVLPTISRLKARLYLQAMHRLSRIVIQGANDKGGTNRARVKAIAIKKDIVAADVALTDQGIEKNWLCLMTYSRRRKC